MDTAAADLARMRWAKARRSKKTCPFCGIDFRGVKEQRYCTPAHQQAAATRRLREKRRAGAETSPPAQRPAPTAIGPRAEAVTSPLDLAMERSHALAEAQWARRDGNEAEAERWERIAAALAEDRSWEVTQDLSDTPF
jgi:hypothetical protein